MYDRDKEQARRSPGKEPDRQTKESSQYKTDRASILRHQEESRRIRSARQRVRPAGGCFGRDNTPAEQAGCRHYP